MKRNKERNGNTDSQFNEAADALELGDPLVPKGSRLLIRWPKLKARFLVSSLACRGNIAPATFAGTKRAPLVGRPLHGISRESS